MRNVSEAFRDTRIMRVRHEAMTDDDDRYLALLCCRVCTIIIGHISILVIIYNLYIDMNFYTTLLLPLSGESKLIVIVICHHLHLFVPSIFAATAEKLFEKLVFL